MEVETEKIVGQKFGKLTVKDCFQKENGRQLICTVQCDCGSEPYDVPLYLLTSGNNKSCGCTRSRAMSKKPIVGEKFNKLIVLEENEETGTGTVQCECGEIFEIPKIRLKMSNLRKNGMCKNCKSQERQKKYTDIEPGTKFHYLTVIKKVEDDDNGQAQYLCKCQCGTKKNVLGKNLVQGKSKSCGCIKSQNFNKLKKIDGLTATPVGKKLYNIWNGFLYNHKNKREEFFPEWSSKDDGFIDFYNWAIHKDQPFDLKERRFLARYDTTSNWTPENCYFSKTRINYWR